MLTVTYGKELSPALTDIYWESLKSLAIEQLEQSAKSCIRNCKHFPKPAELLERWQQMNQVESKPFQPLPPADRKWLALVNGMFLQYLRKRRIDDGFMGDVNVAGRRRECLSLVAWMEGLEADGEVEATENQLRILFDKAMARVHDKTQAKDWLAAQLEFQRQQDRENDKRQREHA